MLTRSFRKLREQIVRANLLVQEASFIAEELDKRTEYRVTLQIPAANLNANRKVRHLLKQHTGETQHGDCSPFYSFVFLCSEMLS